MPLTSTGENKLLNSWKEIAHYLSRGVRTVQRWERDLELPVRRPYKKKRSVVIALSADIDQWLSRAPVALLAHNPGPDLHAGKAHHTAQHISGGPAANGVQGQVNYRH